MNENDIVKKALAFIDEKYDAETVLLYGSFSQGTNTPSSDIDMLVFAKVSEKCHESAQIAGHALDAWIYPHEWSDDVDLSIHILPFISLKDRLNLSKKIEDRIVEERRKRAESLTQGELMQTAAWIEKMLQRSDSNSVESNYRYNWLLNDFPELYCNFRGIYYEGPVKTIRRIREDHPELYGLLEELLGNSKNAKKLRELYDKTKGLHLALPSP